MTVQWSKVDGCLSLELRRKEIHNHRLCAVLHLIVKIFLALDFEDLINVAGSRNEFRLSNGTTNGRCDFR